MGTINLLFANASEYFTDEDKTLIRRAANDAERFIAAHFNFDYDIDFVITAAPASFLSAIPEDGVSGYTYTAQLNIFVIDKSRMPICEDFVYEMICHEMAHSIRLRKLNERMKTLFDGMISEGLAIALEEEAVKNTKRKQQFFLTEVQNTNQASIDFMISQLESQFQNESYDYNTIFITGNDVIPRWAGYKLGYYFVKKIMAESGKTIEELITTRYSEFRP